MTTVIQFKYRDKDVSQTDRGQKYLHREGVRGSREAAQISCTHLLNTTSAHTKKGEGGMVQKKKNIGGKENRGKQKIIIEKITGKTEGKERKHRTNKTCRQQQNRKSNIKRAKESG